MEKFYKVSESKLRELIYDSLRWIALENGGVDNWDWYGASLTDYLHGYNETESSLYDSIYDIATDLVHQEYEEVE